MVDDWDTEFGLYDIWEESEDEYRCADCGHIGKVLEKLVPDWQGDGVMGGELMVATGDCKCLKCESENIVDVDPYATDHDGQTH